MKQDRNECDWNITKLKDERMIWTVPSLKDRLSNLARRESILKILIQSTRAIYGGSVGTELFLVFAEWKKFYHLCPRLVSLNFLVFIWSNNHYLVCDTIYGLSPSTYNIKTYLWIVSQGLQRNQRRTFPSPTSTVVGTPLHR